MNKKADIRGMGKKTGFGIALLAFTSLLHYALGKSGIMRASYTKTILITLALYIAYLIISGAAKWKK